MTDLPVKAYLVALDGMERLGPRDLHRRALIEAEDLDVEQNVGEEFIRAHLRSASPNDELRMALQLRLVTWDSARLDDVSWAEGTEPNTQARREVIIRKLKVDDETSNTFDELFPVAERDGTIIIAESWDPWYTPEIQRKRDFYWEHYAGYLRQQRNWSPEAVNKLDTATRHVVERLNDPTRKQPYQAKGLVVGYVQSGKTANFTGVIAKAIDAGYRLIVVLTGTTNLLREQTQRRLDMELVGQENVLRGVDIENPEALSRVDYQDDPDWHRGRFVSHGGQPSEMDRPDIHRMTTRRFDYRSLQQGIAALDFERRERSKMLFHPDNLFTSDARLVIVKKNKGVLEKLVKDLGNITTRLHSIPALIIDDESDQASINTSNPKRWADGKKERTSINALISTLLAKLPRAQYVGYTATPFANVFVDPGDAEDIFPKNFLISLERPPGYMGAEDFHDLDSSVPYEERTFANSKEKAHIRLLGDRDERTDLQVAMDSFVLAGAIKLYRRERGVEQFQHHTMLVHEAMRTSVHRVSADAIKETWQRAGYFSPSSHARLRKLFDEDLRPVSRAIGVDPIPESFEELVPHLGATARLISASGNPVLVVNSDKDIEQEDLDFDKRQVWRILVGGNKLARGFTVEGLTVSYYLRDVKNADALMQMGRWFGFRRGYRDLVRLFVTPGLRDAFESICRDEEQFREELRQYAVMVDGRPLVTPADVPPLVSSHMLRPTAASKMYNAVLVERRTRSKEPSSGYPSLDDQDALSRNVAACRPLLAAATATRPLGNFDAYVGTVSHSEMLQVLTGLTWAHEHTFAPDLAWLRGLEEGRVRDWEVWLPQQKSGRRAYLLGYGPFSLHGRTTESNHVRGNSTSAHRNALKLLDSGDGRTGRLLLYPVVDRNEHGPGGDEEDPAGVVMALSLLMPSAAAPSDGRALVYSTLNSNLPRYSMVRS